MENKDLNTFYDMKRRFMKLFFVLTLIGLIQFDVLAKNGLMETDAAENQDVVNGSDTEVARESESAEIEIFELPLPELPSSLTNPSERAAYIIEHFWDALDFKDQRKVRNELFMEQNFANFVSVFPFAEENSRKTAVKILTDKAAEDPEVYKLIAAIAEKYLYEPKSPVYSEEYYEIFLTPILTDRILPSEDLLRPKRHLEEINKNRPGTLASDFNFTLRNGETFSLQSLPSEGYILTVFYDPDCYNCRKVMRMLASDTLLNDMIDEGKLTVLAVYSGEEKELWEKTATELPEQWIEGYEPGTIEDDDLYVLPSTPTLYLLDKDKIVLLKNPGVETLMQFLYNNL